jgi:hypothetical protein
MVSGRSGRHHHEAATAATREEAMNPVIIQAISVDQVQAMREHVAARQRAAACRRSKAGRSRRWLGWPGLRRGAASGRSISALSG